MRSRELKYLKNKKDKRFISKMFKWNILDECLTWETETSFKSRFYQKPEIDRKSLYEIFSTPKP